MIPKMAKLFNKSKDTIFAPWISEKDFKIGKEIFNNNLLTRCWILSEILYTKVHYLTWCGSNNHKIKHEKIEDSYQKRFLGSHFSKSIFHYLIIKKLNH